MRDKIYIALVSAVFLFLLLWCPLMAALEKTGMVSFPDNKNYISPERTYEKGQLLSGLLNAIEEGKAKLQNVYTNYLPGYGKIVQRVNDMGSSAQVAFVDMLAHFSKKPKSPSPSDTLGASAEAESSPEPSLPEFSAVYVGEEANRRFYAIRPYEFMESVMKLDEKSLYDNMKGRAAEINRLIGANSEVNFYLYIGKTTQDEEYFADIIPGELCTAGMFGEFMDSIEGAAGKGWIDIDTIEKRLEKQWRTDHHWNAAGSYAAYCDIINMMSKNTPEIGEPVKIKEIKSYPEIKMRGSYAALSGYSRFYEEFFVYDYELPESLGRYSMRSREREYDAGKFERPGDMFLDHYVNYYLIDRRQYAYENNTGRNLLIIGDSLTYWSAWLIAANFDSTYIYFPWDGQVMDYNRYIEDNAITDVLMMVYSQAGIFNVYGYCIYEQLRTE